MKGVLIIGPNSYIAKNLERELVNRNFGKLSVRDERWKEFDYRPFHSIIYLAAIVHHPEIDDEKLYEKVNAKIPYEIAKRAAAAGVKKFIYISSMAAVGVKPIFGNENRITTDTMPLPNTLYGKSKLLGEHLLQRVNGMCIQIVRLPNVYGKDCPGNFFSRLILLSKLPLFPVYKTNYKFSLISVVNVVKAINHLLDTDESGIYCPQDFPVLSITERIKLLSEKDGRKQIQLRCFWPLISISRFLLPRSLTNNLYGGYYIDPSEFPVLTI